jgi:transcriptional regulator with XRE-family HTH domain
MSHWIIRHPQQAGRPIDPEILEESALATAQATIQNAIDQKKISRADLARAMGRPPSFISRMLSGSHNLTIRTMARALAACGFEAHFSYGPIQWGWLNEETSNDRQQRTVPAQAGTPLLAA